MLLCRFREAKNNCRVPSSDSPLIVAPGVESPGLQAAQQVRPALGRRLDEVVVQGPVPPVELGQRSGPGLT